MKDMLGETGGQAMTPEERARKVFEDTSSMCCLEEQVAAAISAAEEAMRERCAVRAENYGRDDDEEITPEEIAAAIREGA